MDKPLPDRIRPLEGVGFWNAMDNAGYRRSQFREWLWPGVCLCIGVAAFSVMMVVA